MSLSKILKILSLCWFAFGARTAAAENLAAVAKTQPIAHHEAHEHVFTGRIMVGQCQGLAVYYQCVKIVDTVPAEKQGEAMKGQMLLSFATNMQGRAWQPAGHEIALMGDGKTGFYPQKTVKNGEIIHFVPVHGDPHDKLAITRIDLK